MILPIFIPHAGCPHQCVFCNQKKISGEKSATVTNAQRQIERWLTWLKPSRTNEAAFYGGSFTGLDHQLQESLLELTDDLLERGVIGACRCSTRPDYINDDALRILRMHSVSTVELGVQSLDDAVLLAAERGHTAQAVYDAMSLLKAQGFTTGIQLMVGMPLQNFASIKDTVEQVVTMKPDIARIYPLLVVKDTPLAKSYAEGKFTPLSLDEAVEQASYVFDKLTQAGIKVIRIGLQPDEELCTPGNILAGPFHPSMGELVKSRSLCNKITPQIQNLYNENVREISITCPNKLHSKLVGLKKCNLDYWHILFPDLKINIVDSNLNLNDVGVNQCI